MVPMPLVGSLQLLPEVDTTVMSGWSRCSRRSLEPNAPADEQDVLIFGRIDTLLLVGAEKLLSFTSG
jgi:hypothetical protein